MQCHWEAGATSAGTQPEGGQGEPAGHQGKPGGRGDPGSLTGHFWFHQKLHGVGGGGRGGRGGGRVSLWPPLSQALALKCAPPLPPRQPSEFLHRGARHRQAEGTQGQPVCPDLQWVGCCCLVCVGPHSIPGGSGIQQRGSTWSEYASPWPPTLPYFPNGGRYMYFGGISHT